jgi:nitrite reductase/ring-hydroxylating ferredoxin subunit
MKRYLLFLFLPLFFACDDSGTNNNNPNIPNISFTITIDTSLPLYNSLQFPGNAVFLPTAGYLGVWVFNTGSGYNAFESTCPNQVISTCSAMTRNGGYLVCPCDSVQYSLYLGSAQDVSEKYPLKAYRVQVNGTSIRIYN